jgi:predicted kinase
VTPSGLIVIGGLPGTGKSTVAAPLARELHAAYLRIDTIEQAMVDSGELPGRPGVAGYLVGYALARDQLGLGVTVVAECVNPLKVTRDAWRGIGTAGWMLEVELVCSDQREHRSRVERRTVDVPGLKLPTWQQVADRDYEPWDREHLIIDTAASSVSASVNTILEQVRGVPGAVA